MKARKEKCHVLTERSCDFVLVVFFFSAALCHCFCNSVPKSTVIFVHMFLWYRRIVYGIESDRISDRESRKLGLEPGESKQEEVKVFWLVTNSSKFGLHVNQRIIS